MKRTKRLSFLMALIIAVTSVAFSTMLSASAKDSSVIVADDFETGYNPISSNAAATLESMKEICDMNPWWYSAKPTVFNKAADVTENTPLIASVVTDGNNNALRITYHATAGIGTNITTPNQANQFVYGAGSYEVSFRFYATKDMQILGIGGKMVDDKPVFYQNNILTKEVKYEDKDGEIREINGVYMGDTETSSPAGIGGTGVNSKTWYTVKVVVNNDQGYYSVEVFDKSGNSLQRVGGINFQDGCPAFSNIRFQAPTEDSVVYIDDYQVKAVNTDTLLYEDDFNNYSALSGTKTEAANIFKEISQFRVLDNRSSYALNANDTDKYFVLNQNANTMYMPWNGYILTKESQALRGKLQMNFSFAVSSTSKDYIKKTDASFRIFCEDEYSSDVLTFTDEKYTMFRVQPFSSSSGVGYGVQKSEADYNSVTYDKNKFQLLTPDKWYDVQLTFDLVNDNVIMELKEHGTTAKITFERSTGLYNNGTPLESIKSIAFHANGGMVIGIDDVEIKYIQEAPQVNASSIEILDFNGERVTAGAKYVAPAIDSIKIPFNQVMSDESLKNITLKAENSETAFTGYTATKTDGVYKMNFTKTLAPNTKYTLTVPATVTNEVGAALATGCTYEFTTGDCSGEAEMGIVGASVKSIGEITNESKITVRTKYANFADEAADCLMILAYYGENNTLLGSTSKEAKGVISANGLNMSLDVSFTVPGAEQLNMSDVKKVSIFLWDSFGNMIPYCESLDIE